MGASSKITEAGKLITRRSFTGKAGLFGLGAAGLAAGCAQPDPDATPFDPEPGTSTGEGGGDGPDRVKRNISTFKSREWQDFFPNLRNGAILVDTEGRYLHYWSEDGVTKRIFPTSVPKSPELTRTGRTSVIQKRIGPDWRPTPNMLKRDPSLPPYVPPGPENPLGTHALYLSWTYYRIHGTNDTRKIGRKSSNGCIGLYNQDIEVLFDWAKVGTQVLLI
jgi:lipoprotein-anchoring transpeptidase ErfK/SrfK